MINSYFIKKNDTIGIYHILINTDDKWISYNIDTNRVNQIGVHFFVNVDEPEFEYDYIEYIDMPESFRCSDYLIFNSQCKDQITLIAISRKSLIDRNLFKFIKDFRKAMEE